VCISQFWFKFLINENKFYYFREEFAICTIIEKYPIYDLFPRMEILCFYPGELILGGLLDFSQFTKSYFYSPKLLVDAPAIHPNVAMIF